MCSFFGPKQLHFLTHIQKFAVGYTPVALELILSFRCFMSLVSMTFVFFSAKDGP